jgi:tRNA threonylcarbamoyladenosine biosynthesis protein TsaE
VIFLRGPLGSGKTTLARGFIRALGVTGPVKSPTFTLVEPHQVGPLSVFHFDLFRVAGRDELELAGWRDYFHAGAICLVEWPERLAGSGVQPDLVVDLTIVDPGRSAHLQAQSPKGQAAIAAKLPPFHTNTEEFDQIP